MDIIELNNSLGEYIENCKVVDMQIVKDGTFRFSDDDLITGLPEMQTVSIELRPSETSYIRVEIWLPLHKWNRRFLGTGNGGSAGGIGYWGLANGVKNGYAVANTDMGTAPDVDLGINNPERWKDFGYRSTHLMTVVAKKVIELFYGESSSYSYFVGASTGGQQALSEAQRYPKDYDGIIAGVPANNRTMLHAYFIWNYQATHRADGTKIFIDEQIKALTDISVKYFKEKYDGLMLDRFIYDPRGTKEDADEIIKRFAKLDGVTNEHCEALSKIYSGPINPKTGERIYTPIPFGSEFSSAGILGQQDINCASGLFYVFRWVFGKEYDYMQFDFADDMDKYNETLASHVNANNPDLSKFEENGGKLIMFSGSADPLVPYQDALSYYERVLEHHNSIENTQNFFKYFIVPGRSHGNDGPGAQNIADAEKNDILNALIAWREKGENPEKLYAIREYGDENDFFRPIYPYPAQTVFDENTGKWIKGEDKYGGVELLSNRYF